MTGPEHRRRGVSFWLGVVVGWAFIGWGLRGIFHHRLATQPARLAYFFVRGTLVHDLILVPVVLLVGVTVARLAPSRWRAGVQAALVIGACLAVFSYPEVRDYASILHNPTSLPRNYAVNLAVSIGVVFAVTTVVVVGQRLRDR